VRGLTTLEECFTEGKLQTVHPSEEKAQESLAAARENPAEAQEALKNGIMRAATNSTSVALFHAARAILFRDGIREKSHFCLIQYVNTYVTSGKLESKWVAFIGSMRSKRDVNQYGFEPPASTDEIETSLQVTAQFIDRMDSLLKTR